MADLSAKLSMLNPTVMASKPRSTPAPESVHDASDKPIDFASSPISVREARFSPAFGPAKPIIQVDFSNSALADDSSINILRNAVRGSVVGGVSRISELIARGDTDYQQDMRQYQLYSFPTKNGEYPPINTQNFIDLDVESKRGMDLVLKTKDGDTIRFSLEYYRGNGMAAGDADVSEQGLDLEDQRSANFIGVKLDFSLEGSLSLQEQQQLDGVVAKLEGLFAQEGVALSELDFSQFDVMADVDIVMSKDGDEIFSFQYHDDASQRTIDFGNTHIKIDKTSLGMGFSAEQQEKAKQAYLSLIEESAREVKQAHSIDVMQAIFTLGFSNLAKKEDDEPILKDGSQLKIIAGASEQIRSSLITLPDFQFSHNSKISQPNAAANPNEYVGFKLSFSLKSQVLEDESKSQMNIAQQQKYKLTGAYYEPLDHLKQVDFENQNYKYTTIFRESEKINRLLIQDGLIEKAESFEQGEARKSTQVYEEGVLVDEVHDLVEFAQYMDFTDLANQQEDKQDQAMLEALIIDPYQQFNEPSSPGPKVLRGQDLDAMTALQKQFEKRGWIGER